MLQAPFEPLLVLEMFRNFKKKSVRSE